jgi:hypothetical protein
MGFFARMSHAAGERRRLVRRVAGICLVALGIHAATDQLDELLFLMLDQLDTRIDEWAQAVVQGMAKLELVDAERADRWCRAWAEWVQVNEKDLASKWMALLIEVGANVTLVRPTWGLRTDLRHDVQLRMREQLSSSWAALRPTLWPISFEQVSLPLIVFTLAFSGVMTATLSLDMAAGRVLLDLFPDGTSQMMVASGLGIFGASLLSWRFLPDLVEGCWFFAHERKRKMAPLPASAPDGGRLVYRLAHGLKQRGLLRVLCVLPVAYLSLLAQLDNIRMLLRMLGAT